MLRKTKQVVGGDGIWQHRIACGPWLAWVNLEGAYSLGGAAANFPGSSGLLARDAGLADSAGEGAVARIF